MDSQGCVWYSSGSPGCRSVLCNTLARGFAATCVVAWSSPQWSPLWEAEPLVSSDPPPPHLLLQMFPADRGGMFEPSTCPKVLDSVDATRGAGGRAPGGSCDLDHGCLPSETKHGWSLNSREQQATHPWFLRSGRVSSWAAHHHHLITADVVLPDHFSALCFRNRNKVLFFFISGSS